MVAGTVFSAASNLTTLLPNQTPPSASQPLDSLFHSSSSSPFLGTFLISLLSYNKGL